MKSGERVVIDDIMALSELSQLALSIKLVDDKKRVLGDLTKSFVHA